MVLGVRGPPGWPAFSAPSTHGGTLALALRSLGGGCWEGGISQLVQAPLRVSRMPCGLELLLPSLSRSPPRHAEAAGVLGSVAPVLPGHRQQGQRGSSSGFPPLCSALRSSLCHICPASPAASLQLELEKLPVPKDPGD